MTDEQLAAQSVVDEFRQALANSQFALAKANALVKIRDRRIAELEATQAPSGPQGPTGDPVQPKPGPPPTR